MSLDGLSVVNIELTSRCNKNCWMCGRRKIEKEHPEMMNFGDMDFSLLTKIAAQLPHNIVVQFHSNGEPLLYPRLWEAMLHFSNQIKTFDTNGKLLLIRAAEVIDSVDTLTVSVIENDPEGDTQFEIVKEFNAIKGNRSPFMIYRLLGNVGKTKTVISNKNLLAGGMETLTEHESFSQEKIDRWKTLPGLIATRILHSPEGSFNYEKKVTIPEHGVCLDLLSHLVIDRYGDCYPCVRFNPNHHNKLGNVRTSSLEEIWNSHLRTELLWKHVRGERKISSPLCAKCDFYGCPTGY